MSRAKEVQILIVDVNPSMGGDFKTAKEAMLMHVQQKIIQAPKTEMGLVCVGTEVTYSDLQDDGYDNIFVKRGIKQVGVDLLQEIEGLEEGVDEGDYLDALVVAADMIHKHCEKKAFEKSIVLVTNFQLAGKDADEIDSITAGLRTQNIALTIYKFGGSSDDTKTVPEGEKVLRLLATGLDKAEVIAVETGALQGAMITRSVKPTTTFRGVFEVSPSLKIKVWTYAATKQASFPTMKKRRKVAGDEGGGGISTNRQYVLQDDNDKEIPREQLIKAFKYGSDQVPVDDTDAANMKVSALKGMWLLAFAPRKKVRPHYLMSNAEVVIPDPTAPEPSTSMLAVLVTAMRECTDKAGNTVEHVAIVRWVKRQNDAPKIFALFAHHNADTNTYCLHACKLPFNEDLRRAPFSALKSNAALQPAADQLDATRAFVSALDIFKHKQAAEKVKKEEEGSEAAVLMSTPMDSIMVFNPVVQHFYHCVNHKAVYGDGGESSSTKTVPPPPEKGDLAKVLHPDEKLWGLASGVVERMKDAFKIPVLEEKAKRKAPDDDSAGDAAKGGTDGGAIKIEDDDDEKSKKARVDGDGLGFSFAPDKAKDGAFDTTNPEAHFEMLWKREDLDAHENAVKEMTKHVIDIVDNSPGERFYSKAVSCLKKLRVFCDAGRNDEPDLFNESFEQLRDKYQSRSDISFWAFLLKEGVERIRTSDAEDEPPALAPVAAAPAAASIPDDDLLDDAD